MEQKNVKQAKKFVEQIACIKDPAIFLGVARLLKVKTLKDEKDENGKFLVRDFGEVLDDVISSYVEMPRQRRRELLSILKKANSAPDVIGESDVPTSDASGATNPTSEVNTNADRTEDSEESVSD